MEPDGGIALVVLENCIHNLLLGAEIDILGCADVLNEVISMMNSHFELDWNKNWLALRVVRILHRNPNIKLIVKNPRLNEIYGQLIMRKSDKLLNAEVLDTIVARGEGFLDQELTQFLTDIHEVLNRQPRSHSTTPKLYQLVQNYFLVFFLIRRCPE